MNEKLVRVPYSRMVPRCMETRSRNDDTKSKRRETVNIHDNKMRQTPSVSLFRILTLASIFNSLFLGRHCVWGNEQSTSYHDQVQQRVREQIRNFMSGPTIALQYWSDYYNLDGFENELNGADRDTVAKYLYSMALTSNYWMPFYGLENGVFLGYFHDQYNTVPRLLYREPGDSGYSLDTLNDLSMYKDTCVNKESGEVEECVTVEDGGSYVSCVNDCELVKCNSNAEVDDVQNDLFQQQEDCSIHLEGSKEKQDCESKIVWCKNYSIEKTASQEVLQEKV